MLYQGQHIRVETQANGISRLVFDSAGETLNTLKQASLQELDDAIRAVANDPASKALLLCSAKPAFIVGADISEFAALSRGEAAHLAASLWKINQIFCRLEDLSIPTAAAINGMALGGGLETALACDFRLADSGCKLGFPEVKLGIIPGYGGTVRAPRLIGVDNAAEWIAGGREYRAEEALKVGLIDAVLSAETLLAASEKLLLQAIAGDFDLAARRRRKTQPLALDDIEAAMVFTTVQAVVAQQAGRHYPAPLAAVKAMQQHARLGRDTALQVEGKTVVGLIKSDTAQHLIALFFGDQLLGKTAKKISQQAPAVQQAAVLGAGIMGGGIAYQSATRGVPILMKDIAQQGLDAGIAEAAKLLSKQLARGRIDGAKMASTLTRITPTLHYQGFAQTDLVVEAVVENMAVKKAVLAEVEQHIGADCVLTSNTSTISISALAEALERPQNFCGMHFFNPVHRMPLVEVIRGEKSSDATIAKTVAYALALGKKPVVVNDCPGFLVNRILFAYFGGYMRLLKDGADYLTIDKVMEAFGWPMGPAYLLDVVGIDTAVHAAEVMAQGFAQRMAATYKTASQVLLEQQRLGQKNSLGFYRYSPDKKGKLQKQVDEQTRTLLAEHVDKPREFSERDIVERMMIPMCLEAYLCLNEGIAACAVDIDMALIYGVGFPPFRGGIMRYMDSLGLQAFCASADRHAALGPLYQVPESLRELAQKQQQLSSL